MKRATLLIAGAGVGLCLAAQVWAGAPTDQARQYTDQVLKVLQDAALKPAQRQAAVRKVAIEIFDVSETARRALGRHWQSRTPVEREEFTRLFAELLESTYISKIGLYGGEQLKYVGESIDGDFAVVRATILRRRGAEVPVEARMLRRSDRWYIYDIAVEGISLINNYRAQFNRIIQTSSYDELVRRLRMKRDEEPNGR
ncbi:MAG: ABC transporter substrate-binding protein [candidate division NC10 bacterium]